MWHWPNASPVERTSPPYLIKTFLKIDSAKQKGKVVFDRFIFKISAEGVVISLGGSIFKYNIICRENHNMKKNILNIIPDRILLIITAVAVLVLMVWLTSFLKSRNVSDKVINLIGCYLVYIMANVSVIRKSRIMRNRWDIKAVFSLSCFILIPIVIFSLLFYYRVLNLPESLITYFMWMLFLSVLTAMSFERFMNRIMKWCVRLNLPPLLFANVLYLMLSY